MQCNIQVPAARIRSFAAAPIVIRLLRNKCEVDALVFSRLLADDMKIWKAFVLDATCASAVSKLLLKFPQLAQPSFIAAIGACDAAVVMRLLRKYEKAVDDAVVQVT